MKRASQASGPQPSHQPQASASSMQSSHQPHHASAQNTPSKPRSPPLLSHGMSSSSATHEEVSKPRSPPLLSQGFPPSSLHDSASSASVHESVLTAPIAQRHASSSRGTQQLTASTDIQTPNVFKDSLGASTHSTHGPHVPLLSGVSDAGNMHVSHNVRASSSESVLVNSHAFIEDIRNRNSLLEEARYSSSTSSTDTRRMQASTTVCCHV
jgi:hypothetical protein